MHQNFKAMTGKSRNQFLVLAFEEKSTKTQTYLLFRKQHPYQCLQGLDVLSQKCQFWLSDNNILSLFQLPLCTLMDFSITFDTVKSGWLISPKNIILLWRSIWSQWQCRPWWNAALCSISSGSSLFAKVPILKFPVWKEVNKVCYYILSCIILNLNFGVACVFYHFTF